MSSRSRTSSLYLGRVTRTQLDNAADRHLTVVPDDDYVPASAHMAPTGTDQWQPTIVDPDGYTGLELADGAA